MRLVKLLEKHRIKQMQLLNVLSRNEISTALTQLRLSKICRGIINPSKDEIKAIKEGLYFLGIGAYKISNIDELK